MSGDAALRAAQQVLADCQRKLARHRAALEAGGDPAVITQWIAEVTQQQRAAQRTQHNCKPPPPVSDRSTRPWCGRCWRNSGTWPRG